MESEHGCRPESIRLADLTADVARSYLDAVEASGCAASTRNQRLAAVKSFARYTVREEPAFMLEGQRILAIPSKRVPGREVEYLERDALGTILASPDPTTPSGRRDLAVMAMLYDSAARVQELIDLRVGDVRLGPTACVTLHGKGRKVRTVPIMERTAAHVSRHLEDRSLPRDGSRLEMRLFCPAARATRGPESQRCLRDTSSAQGRPTRESGFRTAFIPTCCARQRRYTCSTRARAS